MADEPAPSAKRPERSLGPNWVQDARKQAHATMRRLDRGRRQAQIRAIAEIDDPVERARRIAELAAPADMELLQAIRFGLDPETADRYRHPLRLAADIASRSLSIVGLRAGDVQTFDVSERLRDFLEHWHAAPGASSERIIDVTPEAPRELAE